MELTDIHRVSTDMALEDLVELSTISATGITIASKCSDMAIIKGKVTVMNLRGADIDGYCDEVETKDDTPSRFVMQEQPGRDPGYQGASTRRQSANGHPNGWFPSGPQRVAEVPLGKNFRLQERRIP